MPPMTTPKSTHLVDCFFFPFFKNFHKGFLSSTALDLDSAAILEKLSCHQVLILESLKCIERISR